MTTLGFELLGLGTLLVLANWSLLIGIIVTKKQGGTSFLPLFGGALAFVGCVLLPAVRWQFGLIAFAIDPGCWLLAAPVVWGVQRLRAR